MLVCYLFYSYDMTLLHRRQCAVHAPGVTLDSGSQNLYTVVAGTSLNIMKIKIHSSCEIEDIDSYSKSSLQAVYDTWIARVTGCMCPR